MKPSIYSVVNYMYVMALPFGMAPFTLRYFDGKYIYEPLRNFILQFLIIILVSACMIFFQDLYITQTVSANTTETLLRFFSWLKIGSAIITMVIVTYHHRFLAVAFERIYQFDSYMFKLDRNASLHNWIVYIALFLLVIVTFGFPTAFGVLAYYFDGLSPKLIVYDTLSTGVHCIIHSFVGMYLFIYVIILFIRFHYLHSTLAKFVDNNNTLRSDPIETLNSISSMYAILCNGAIQLNKVFSFSLFLMVLSNMLETMLSVYLILGLRIHNEKMIVYGAYNMAIVVIILLPTGILFRRTKGLARYLTESTFCYKNETASLIRGSFMLQTLQEDVQFQASGCFNLTMATFIDQMSVCISLILFLYQLVNIKY